VSWPPVATGVAESTHDIMDFIPAGPRREIEDSAKRMNTTPAVIVALAVCDGELAKLSQPERVKALAFLLAREKQR
jgi:hypothetical protein